MNLINGLHFLRLRLCLRHRRVSSFPPSSIVVQPSLICNPPLIISLTNQPNHHPHHSPITHNPPSTTTTTTTTPQTAPTPTTPSASSHIATHIDAPGAAGGCAAHTEHAATPTYAHWRAADATAREPPHAWHSNFRSFL